MGKCQISKPQRVARLLGIASAPLFPFPTPMGCIFTVVDRSYHRDYLTVMFVVSEVQILFLTIVFFIGEAYICY